MLQDVLGDLFVFRMVAAERSMTRAALRLGMTQSALSQAIKRLESRLGIKVLARTTRSVAPTQAGEQLLKTLIPALADIGAGIEALTDLRERPAGTIRITTGKHAAQTILWPALSRLLKAYPDIQVEVSVDSTYLDIVAHRFDAGIRMGERLEQDMVAIPIGPSLRTAVVASPAYLALKGRPATPRELAGHQCIGCRSADGGLYSWEFEKDGRPLGVRVGAGPIVNDGDLMIAAALEGFGLAHLMEDMVEQYLADGRLVRVLDDWCPPFAGYHLYYPGRRQQTQAFKLFVEALKGEI